MKKHSLIVGIGLAAILLGLFVWQLDWHELQQILQHPAFGYLVLGLLHGFSVYIFRGIRWLILLRAIGDVSFHSSFWADNVGFGINVLLPGRMGEVARAVFVARRHTLPISKILATVVLERLSDLIFSAVVFFIYVGFSGRLFVGPIGAPQRAIFGAMLKGTVVIVGGFILAIGILSVLGRRARDHVDTRLPFPGILRRIQQFLSNFASAVRTMGRARLVALYGVVTVLFWAYVMLGYQLHVRAFRFAVPWRSLPWVNVLVMMGAALPTPGGVGGYHWSFRLALNLFYGIDKDMAAAAAIWSHICAMMPPVVLTVYYMVRHHVHLSELVNRTSAESESDERMEIHEVSKM